MLRQRIAQSSKRSLRSYSTATSASTTSAAPAAAPVVTPVVKKPAKRIGGFRGGFLGFFLGVSVTSLATYSYVLDQHKTSSNVIISDVLSLQKSIRTLEEHVRALERSQSAPGK